MANVADGLAAIQRFIFEERSLTWDELIAALDDNYDGHERLRQKILHRAPKYGNDDDEVDALIQELAEFFCDELHARTANPLGPGGKAAAGFMTFGLHGRLGLPASPDGRRQGEHIANSFSPALGRDQRGPTAVLKSVGKVDLRKASHGSVLDLAFHTSALRGENGLRKFMAFVDTFLKMPCSTTLQINTIDRDLLLQAREDPTNPAYRTLIVRVWGWSGVFVELHPDLQQHVLERTEHTF
jgi:formate C-acetyltransferase